jgi:hypothetical protein
MKQIKLGNKDLYAMVDDDDYDRVIKMAWHSWRCRNIWYAVSSNNRKRKFILMHRFILDATRGTEIDHIDRNGLNNQKSNLRYCSNSQNQQNKTGWAKSGYKGVYPRDYKGSIRYRVLIQINKKTIHIGYFSTAEEAAKEYDKAALQYFGEFANLNFKNNPDI